MMKLFILQILVALLNVDEVIRITGPCLVNANEPITAITNGSLQQGFNETNLTSSTTTTTGNPVWDKCYVCKYNSAEPKVQNLNDERCLSENPKVKVPCPYSTCAIWTLKATAVSHKFESTAKLCASPKVLKCYEKVTGSSLEYGTCQKKVKLSKKQLDILLSGECGDLKIPGLPGTGKSRSSNFLSSGGDDEDGDNWISEVVGRKAVDEYLKLGAEYEICVCTGNLCNTYPMPEKIMPKKSTRGKSSSFRSNLWILLSFTAALYFVNNAK